MIIQSGVPVRDRSSWYYSTTVVCGLVKSIPRPIQPKGHIFPASGYRNNSSGSLNNVGSNGYYWSAPHNSRKNGHNHNLNPSKRNWNNNKRANGFPVRAVAEAFADRRTLPFCFAKFQGKTTSSSLLL